MATSSRQQEKDSHDSDFPEFLATILQLELEKRSKMKQQQQNEEEENISTWEFLHELKNQQMSMTAVEDRVEEVIEEVVIEEEEEEAESSGTTSTNYQINKNESTNTDNRLLMPQNKDNSIQKNNDEERDDFNNETNSEEWYGVEAVVALVNHPEQLDIDYIKWLFQGNFTFNNIIANNYNR